MILGGNNIPEISEKFKKIFQFLLQLQRSEKNFILAQEAFGTYFSAHQEDFLDFIQNLELFLGSSHLTGEKEKLARRYIFIFSQLCERFGFYDVKLRLDDLSFHIENPQDYKIYQKKLEKYQKKSKKILQEIQKILESDLKNIPYTYYIEGRYKNLFSIYKKCQKKGYNDIKKLGDIFAFRIIYEGESYEAYNILALLHSKYKNIPERFKDYIEIPKINGYQSLHTAISHIHNELDFPIEIQIRNKAMDEINRNGNAAHYLYSQNKKSEILTEKEKKILLEHYNTEKISFIYVLTYTGDIIKISENSNILNFAEKIHSALPKKITGALVNGEKKHPYQILENFDIIQLLQ